MTTYRTGNAIGSADPRDLYDNSENLDELVNSQDKLSHPDRLGVPRKTWHGMEQEFQAAQADKQQRFNALLAASGYVFVGDYAAGITVSEYNEVIRDTAGNLWRAASTTELPYTTDGTGMPEGGAFVSAGDAVLRNDLMGEPVNGQGALLVRGSVIYVNTIADLHALDTSSLVDGQQVQVKEYHANTSVGGGEFYWDATSEEVDNGGTVFGDAASGRWRRIKDYTDAFMFGAIPGGAVSATDALMRAAEYTSSRGETLYLRRGQYLLDGPAIDLENFRVIGESGAEIVGDTSTTFCRLRDGLHIEGLTFSGIHSVFYNVGIATQENLEDITITNNIIKNCARFGMHSYTREVDYNVISNIDRLTITANKVLGCGNGVAISAMVTDALIADNILLDTGFELSGGAAIRCIEVGLDPSVEDPIVLNQGGSGVVRGNTVRRFGSNNKDISTHGILLFGNFFTVSHNHIEENIGSSDNKISTRLHGIYLKGSGNVVSSNTLLNSANAGGAITIKPLWDAGVTHIGESHVNNIIETNNIEFTEDYYPEYRLTAIRCTGRGSTTVIGNHASGCRGVGIFVSGDNSLVSNNNLTDYKGHSGSQFSRAILIENSLRSVVSDNAIECRQVENNTIAIAFQFGSATEGQDAPLSITARGNEIVGFGTGASAILSAFQVGLNNLPETLSGSGLVRLDANTLSSDANITGRMFVAFGVGISIEAFVVTGNVVIASGGSAASTVSPPANLVIIENNVEVPSP